MAKTHVNPAKGVIVFMFDAVAHTRDTACHSKRLLLLGTDSFAGDGSVPQMPLLLCQIPWQQRSHTSSHDPLAVQSCWVFSTQCLEYYDLAVLFLANTTRPGFHVLEDLVAHPGLLVGMPGGQQYCTTIFSVTHLPTAFFSCYLSTAA